jgi:hypothetical protein
MTYIVVTLFLYKNKKTRENKEKKIYTMEYACKRPKKDPLNMLVKDQKSKQKLIDQNFQD